MNNFEEYMREALLEADRAALAQEVPVGAVLVHKEKIIARAFNTVEQDRSVAAHAEMKVINQASSLIGNWRLSDTVLCVTLEPCPMCAGAIRLSRIPTLVFGARDQRMGAFGSLYDLAYDRAFGPEPRVVSGILEQECAARLKDFFQRRRSASS